MIEDLVCAVDPGHGGHNNGARSPRGEFEKNLTLGIAQRAKDLDPEILLTRAIDATITYEHRAQFLASHGAHLVVQVHLNRNDDPRPGGLEAYHHRGNGLTRSLGRWCCSRAPRELQPGRVIDAHGPYGTEGARYLVEVYPMHALLLELGYLSNADDLAYLTSEGGMDACARLVVGCCREFKRLNGGDHRGGKSHDPG